MVNCYQKLSSLVKFNNLKIKKFPWFCSGIWITSIRRSFLAVVWYVLARTSRYVFRGWMSQGDSLLLLLSFVLFHLFDFVGVTLCGVVRAWKRKCNCFDWLYLYTVRTKLWRCIYVNELHTLNAVLGYNILQYNPLTNCEKRNEQTNKGKNN